MKFVTRSRLVAAGWVVAFVAVLAGIGAVSKSTPAATVAATPGLPQVLSGWYWTMAVSPTDPNVLVLATGNGLFRSTDAGKSWASTGPKSISATSLAQVGSSLYAGGVVIGTNPNPVIRNATGRTAPDGAAVLAVSSDSGVTWKTLHPKGLPNTSVQALATDQAKTTLYALLNTGALYSSTDGAQTFKLVSAKIGIAPWAITVAQHDQFVSGDMDSGSHVSANAKSWLKTPFKDSRSQSMVMEYAVQPTDMNRVLMTSEGIEISNDAGKTWHLALKSQVMFGPVAYAPSKTSIAYAVGFDRSLWRSTDGGMTWKQISS